MHLFCQPGKFTGYLRFFISTCPVIWINFQGNTELPTLNRITQQLPRQQRLLLFIVVAKCVFNCVVCNCQLLQQQELLTTTTARTTTATGFQCFGHARLSRRAHLTVFYYFNAYCCCCCCCRCTERNNYIITITSMCEITCNFNCTKRCA